MPAILALLLLAAPPAQDGDRREFRHKDANIKLTYPRSWNRTRLPDENYQLGLMRGGNFLMLGGQETPASVEAMIDEIEQEQQLIFEEFKVVDRDELKVGGERAIRIRAQMKQQGLRMNFVMIVFTHQGIAYRLLGIYTGAREAFDRDLAGILETVEFLEDRKEWLEKFEGKPTRTAFLGGLADLELNRPRWTDATFESEREWGLLDQVDFSFLGQGAWIRVRAAETSLGAAGELEALRHALSARLQKPVAAAGTVGSMPVVEISGLLVEQKYLFRAAVLVSDGVAVRVWMEEYDSQRELTRKDWEQLVSGLRLQPRSKPAAPPAFPLRADRVGRKPDPALAAFLGQAVRVAPESPTVIAVSPDGTRAILHDSDEGNSMLMLATGKREKLDLDPASMAIRWSRDGKRAVYAAEGETVVVTFEPFEAKKLKIAAEEASFGPGADDLLLVTAKSSRPGLRSFSVHRLEAVKVGEESPRPLVEYPLARLRRPVVSPDGKRIAFVANRDYPRSADSGGHVYLADADGGNMKALTEGAEDPEPLGWSADGRSLYVLRRLAAGEDGAVGVGGDTDLFRVPLEGGAPVNLTRSGKIAAAWVAGGDLFLRTVGWELPDAQKGTFRIAAEALEKATAARPVPPPSDPRAAMRRTAERVEAALGGPAKDAVPTPELLEKAARAFAEAARETAGVDLDFTAESLDRISDAIFAAGIGSGAEPAAILGAGAYYGETLRRVAGAEWKLKAAPFGAWAASDTAAANLLAEAVLPFSAVLATGLGSENLGLRTSEALKQDEGRKLLLVYPPSHAEEAVREAAGTDYAEARKKLDAGDVSAAISLLVRELQRRPKNRALAEEVIALCEATGKEDAAKNLTEKAVEAGNEVPQLLIRYADGLMERDPKAAIEYYRKAVQDDWPPAEALIKLGKAYAGQGQRPLAECCWRRAHRNADEAQRTEILGLLGLSPPK